MVSRKREEIKPQAASKNHFRSRPICLYFTVSQIQRGNASRPIDILGKNDLPRGEPLDPTGGRFDAGRDVTSVATGGGYNKNIAANTSLITHETSNECNLFPVGRPLRLRQLQGRF